MEESRIPRITSAERVRVKADQLHATGMDRVRSSPQANPQVADPPFLDRRDQLHALLTLERIPGLGPVGIRALLEREGSGREALGSAGSLATADVIRNASREAGRVLDATERLARERPECNPDIIGIGLHGYPARLMDLPDPPPVLFAMGDLELIERPAVATPAAPCACPQDSPRGRRRDRTLLPRPSRSPLRRPRGAAHRS